MRSIESLSRDEDREYGGQEVEPADEGENPAGVFLLIVETVEQILRRVGLLDASKDRFESCPHSLRVLREKNLLSGSSDIQFTIKAAPGNPRPF